MPSILAVLLLLSIAVMAQAQRAKVYRIGYLRDEKAPEVDIEGVFHGLQRGHSIDR
jgi:hypothetical protein